MWTEPQSLITGAGTASFNTNGVGDDLVLDPNMCGWTVDVRLAKDDTPRDHGSLVWPRKRGAGHLRLGGRFKPSTDTAAARDAQIATFEAICEYLFDNTGTYSQPSGRGTLTVGLEVYPAISGGFRKWFELVLIAPDGEWT